MSIRALLQHGHQPRLEHDGNGWKIVLTLDGLYVDQETALRQLNYWRHVVDTAHAIGMIDRKGTL